MNVLQHIPLIHCSSCHRLIDPIGFGFERYDGIGRYRENEAGELIDSRALIEMSGGQTEFNGVGELAALRSERASRSTSSTV